LSEVSIAEASEAVFQYKKPLVPKEVVILQTEP
jgi:hypothetical protein